MDAYLKPGEEELRLNLLCAFYDTPQGADDVLLGAVVHALRTAKDEKFAEMEVLSFIASRNFSRLGEQAISR